MQSHHREDILSLVGIRVLAEVLVGYNVQGSQLDSGKQASNALPFTCLQAAACTSGLPFSISCSCAAPTGGPASASRAASPSDSVFRADPLAPSICRWQHKPEEAAEVPCYARPHARIWSYWVKVPCAMIEQSWL